MSNSENRVLEHLAIVDRGISWEKSQEKREQGQHSIPVLRIPNVQSRIDLSDMLYLSDVEEVTRERYLLKKNDIVMVGSNGNHSRIGDAAYIDRDMECLYASFLIGIKPKNGINPQYLAYALKSEDVRKKISLSISGTTGLANVAITFIRNLKIPTPPLPEQSRIAEILSTVDQVIELTEKEISRLEDLKKGMMCDLTYGRLEGGERTTWENITTPKDWGYKTIGSILRQIERPITLDDNATYQLITVKRRNEGIVEREALLGKKILVKNYFSLKKGDFVISKRQIVHGACEIVPPTLDGSVVSNEYDVFTGTEEMDIDFFNEFAKTPTMKEIFFRYSQGVDIEKMIFKTNWWLKQVIPVPPIEYQNKVVTALKSVNTQIQNRKSKLSSLQSLKKALMNDLLTGKVRVKV